MVVCTYGCTQRGYVHTTFYNVNNHIFQPNQIQFSPNLKHNILSGYCTQNIINTMVACTHMCTQKGNVHTNSYNVHNLISQPNQLKFSPNLEHKVLLRFQAQNIANVIVVCTYCCTQLGNVHTTFYNVHHQ